jgi:tRNA(Ile)-lysidine synthase
VRCQFFSSLLAFVIVSVPASSSFVASVAHAVSKLRPADGKLVVACSGGPDSFALLAALDALRVRLSLTLIVASVDHHFRAASSAEADGVVAWARARGLVAEKLDVYPAQKTQDAARVARYRALGDCAIAHGASTIVVAHTASDQAETMLDRMLRGTGIAGLGGMAPTRTIAPAEFGCAAPLTLVRPLLAITRAEVEAFAAAAALPVARDPSNADPHYRRARLRKHVLPALRTERPDLDLAWAQLATRLRGTSEIVDYAVRRALADVAAAGRIDVTRLAALPPPLQAEVLRRASPFPLGERHVAALIELCRHAEGSRTIDLPGGRARRTYQHLALTVPVASVAGAPLPIAGPGTYPFATGYVRITPAFFTPTTPPLTLRNVRAGDRYLCPRLHRPRRVQNLLVNEKIPRHERAELPALAYNHVGGSAVLHWLGGIPRFAHPEIMWLRV